jgi:transcriptional regulator with XRE-family HTH domain
MSGLTEWIVQQLKERGWRQADLAQASGLTNATLSRILSGSRRAGPEACAAIATALDVLPEQVFRLAGLLPPVANTVEEEEEALGLFRRLDGPMRRVALGILRALGRLHAPGPAGQPALTLSERLAREIARDLETMPPQDQQRVLDLMRRLRGAERADGVPVEPKL